METIVESRERVFGKYSKDEWDDYRLRIYADLQRKRKAIFERDGNHCVVCYTNRNLQVHHGSPVAGEMKLDYSIELINKDENLITLCQWCHYLIENEPPVGTLWWERYIAIRKEVSYKYLNQLNEAIRESKRDKRRKKDKDISNRYKEALVEEKECLEKQGYKVIGYELGTDRMLVRAKEMPELIEENLENRDNHNQDDTTLGEIKLNDEEAL